MSIESQIVNQLLHNEEFAKHVFPFLEREYFASTANQIIFDEIKKYSDKYSSYPSVTAIDVQLSQSKLDEHHFDAAKEELAHHKVNHPVDTKWMIDQAEEYVQERAINNALRESIAVLDGAKQERGNIPDKLRQALSVSFDRHLGHNYLADAEARYDKLHGSVVKIPFSLETLNKATEGGIEEKTINVLIAGCVHPDTYVNIKYAADGIERVVRTRIGEIETLIKETEVYVDSPQGWVPIVEFVHKGLFEEYRIKLDDGRFLLVNEDHLVFSNIYGWITTKELAEISEFHSSIHIHVKGGTRLANAQKTGMMIPIVDIVVGTEEHEYYAEDVLCHNTNVGKSLMMCQLAADYVLAGHQVMYFTMEMSEEKIGQRIDANLLGVDLKDYKKMPKEWFLRKIEEIKKKTGGDINVKEYPSSSANIGHFRHHLQELKLKKNFKPTVVMFDYLNIIASARYRSGAIARHLYVSSVAEELRGLCQEVEAGGWTAAQTNRGGFDSSDPTITDSAEAFGLNYTADLVWMISQPEELEEMNQFLFRQEKSRYTDKGEMRKFFMGVEKQQQKLYDLDAAHTLDPANFPDDEPTPTTENVFDRF